MVSSSGRRKTFFPKILDSQVFIVHSKLWHFIEILPWTHLILLVQGAFLIIQTYPCLQQQEEGEVVLANVLSGSLHWMAYTRISNQRYIPAFERHKENLTSAMIVNWYKQITHCYLSWSRCWPILDKRPDHKMLSYKLEVCSNPKVGEFLVLSR